MAPVPKLDSADGASKSDELVGSILNERYEILRLLNEGGMAKIYVARHTVLGREIAIKVLKAGCADDTDVVQRFINEGRAAGTLGHPNIVECTDIGTTPDGKPYLVLELLAGHSLADEIIRSGPLAIGRAAKIASRIADALATAHASGIVHRDLKSDNVFLARKRGVTDWVKVLDFGVSKFDSEPVGTQKGSMLGTPDFMAPEQVVDARAVDSRADIYALGVVLYEMLTGRRPFHGISFPMVLYCIAHEPPPGVKTLRADVSAELVAVVEKAMAKRPEDRYASMFDVVAALEPFADRISMDASMDDLVASSSAKLTVMAYSDLQLGAADEKRRSSSAGAMPTSATLRNASDKKTFRSTATILGAVAFASILGLGMVALMWDRTGRSAGETVSPRVAPPPPEVIGVMVSITPPEALIEVDGRPVEISKGALRIQGIVGTVRHVRAFVGSHEVRRDVVISLDGAVPSRIEVVVPLPSASASAIAPVAPSASASTLPLKKQTLPRPSQGINDF